MLRVLEAGLLATVQDGGRLGHLRSGVPPSGAADPFALRAANALVGNDPGDAAVEIAGPPFAFALDDTRLVAVAGRDVSVAARHALAGWTAAVLRAGETATVRGGARARFAYVAVAGGIATMLELGSRSTYAAGLGKRLASADTLPLGEARAGVERAGSAVDPPRYGAPVRVLDGPHADRFSAEAFARLYSSPFTVDVASDRMGSRLRGPDIRARPGELLTCGVLAGAIQVPHGGAPIVLLADHQTTGGYPVIATVIAADLGLVAQASPGDELRFARVSREEAIAALRERRDAIARAG